MVALTLAESLLFLCIDYRGKVTKTFELRYSMAGALILDLALENKITISQEARPLIEYVEGSESTSTLHNELLKRINNSWARPVKRWIAKMGRGHRNVRKQLLLSLQEKRIIERKSGLLTRYAIINKTIQDEIINTLRNLQTTNQKTRNYIYCLVALIRIAKLLFKIPNIEFIETPPFEKEAIKTIADDKTRIYTAFVIHEIERFILINNILTTVSDCLECCDCA
ncbi:MAG: GPP34 family phosphoprotein [Asgard group archaeon]|nr:GPP34 family phosphoprotein [Asgard group archaeon]